MSGSVGSSAAAGFTIMGEVARLCGREGFRDGLSELFRDGSRDVEKTPAAIKHAISAKKAGVKR